MATIKDYSRIYRIVEDKLFHLWDISSHERKGNPVKAIGYADELEHLRDILPSYKKRDVRMMPLAQYKKMLSEVALVDCVEVDGNYVKASFVYENEDDGFDPSWEDPDTWNYYDEYTTDEAFEQEQKEELFREIDTDPEVAEIILEYERERVAERRKEAPKPVRDGILIVYTAPMRVVTAG